jgi:hypothetical protein
MQWTNGCGPEMEVRCLQNITSNAIGNRQHAVLSHSVTLQCSRLLRLSCKQAAATAANALCNAFRLLSLHR